MTFGVGTSRTTHSSTPLAVFSARATSGWKSSTAMGWTTAS
jgi:hypothetical protein